MKKIFVIVLFIFIYGVISSNCIRDITFNELTKDEIKLLKEYDIDQETYLNYKRYNNFNIQRITEYEKYRNNNHSILESINLVNNPFYYKGYEKKEKALFLNTFLVLVNKHYYVDKDYIPSNLVSLNDYNINFIKRSVDNNNMFCSKEVAERFEEMSIDASLLGLKLVCFSAYRSYQKQKSLYNEENKDYVAKEGHSEHQTGLSLDISTENFGLTNYLSDSLEFQWLKDNCFKYGFILRYTQEKKEYTLYNSEVWHFRYVGKTIATYIYNNNLCLEEYIIKNYEL